MANKDKETRIALCRWCGKPTTEWFVIGDDLENPKPYHKDCLEAMKIEILIEEVAGKDCY